MTVEAATIIAISLLTYLQVAVVTGSASWGGEGTRRQRIRKVWYSIFWPLWLVVTILRWVFKGVWAVVYSLWEGFGPEREK